MLQTTNRSTGRSTRQIVAAAWLTIISITAVHAAPNDVAYFQGFDASNFPWTRSNTQLAGSSNASTQTRNSGARGMFTRSGAVTVTGPTLNLSNLPGAAVTAWVRRGSDSFNTLLNNDISEEPEAGEDLVFEYLNNTGAWVQINRFVGNENAPGVIFNFDSGTLPADALHSNFRLRIRQLGGTPPNRNFFGVITSFNDYWHIHDIRVVQRNTTTLPQTLAVGRCDDFESGLNLNWNISGIVGDGEAGTSLITSQSSISSLFTAAGGVTVTSNSIDTTAPNFTTVSFWLREGLDTLTNSNTNSNSNATVADGNRNISEDIDPDETLTVEYLNASNSWVRLETFSITSPGQVRLPEYSIPSDGRHSNFRLRFTHDSTGSASGTETGLDFWHIDDVCLNFANDPLLIIQKPLPITLSDPINGTNNPKMIPGAIVEYSVQVTNSGAGPVTADTLVISDPVPNGTHFIISDMNGAGSGPVRFEDGNPTSGLSYEFTGLDSSTDDLTFFNAAGTPITPTADSDNSDANIHRIEISPGGSLLPQSTAGNPSFTVFYRVIIQ